MPFPIHVQAQTTLSPNPWQYYQLIHIVQNTEQWHHMQLVLCEEMGSDVEFDKLIFHISTDILDVTLERYNEEGADLSQQDKQKMLQFVHDVINLNAEKYQESLQESYQALKPCKKEMVSLL